MNNKIIAIQAIGDLSEVAVTVGITDVDSVVLEAVNSHFVVHRAVWEYDENFYNIVVIRSPRIPEQLFWVFAEGDLNTFIGDNILSPELKLTMIDDDMLDSLYKPLGWE